MKVRRYAGTLCFVTKLTGNDSDSTLPEDLLDDDDVMVCCHCMPHFR